jgi:2-phospho-L-lactate/phosphoenolpyruvate guanylyltransferase
MGIQTRVTAVVPLNALSRAKGRLAADLDARTRQELAAWMCGLVLDACLQTPSVDRVLLVAGDAAAAAVAGHRDVCVLTEPRPGLAPALQAAETAAGPELPLLVVAADLPLATVDDLEAVCRAGARAPAVVVAPTLDGGTGALLRNPGSLIPTAFGPASARRHLALAAAAGVPGIRMERAGLALDVDTARQLRAARSVDGRLDRWAALLGP